MAQTAAQKKAAALVDKSARETPTAPQRSGDTVTVCCKLPHGLTLQAQEPYEQQVAVPQGMERRTEKMWRPFGQKVLIAGNALPVGGTPSGDLKHGVAITYGVPRELWELWLDQNHDHDAVVNGLIFIAESREDAFAMAKDMRKVKTGMEPLDMTMVRNKSGNDVARDPRLPNRLPGVAGITSFNANVGQSAAQEEQEDADAA